MTRAFAGRIVLCFALLTSIPALAQGTGVHVTLRANANPFPAYQSYAGVWGDGNYAYIGSERRNGVLIYDVSNPDDPVLAGTYAPSTPNSFDMEDIKVANGIGYFADNFGTGLHVVDVSNPANPTLLSQITSANGGYDKCHKVAVWQNFVFIPQNLVAPALIKVFDITNPASPVLFTTITATDSQWVNDLDIQTTTDGQTRMYTAGWNNKGDIWDITNLATTGPVLLGSFKAGVNGSSVSATEDGNYLAYSRKTLDGKSEVKIWNISNPAAAVVVATITMSVYGIDAIAPHDPKIMGNLLYVSWFQAGTLIFDITNRAAPVFVGSYDTYAGVVSPAQLDGDWGVYPYLGQDRVLLSDRNTGLYVVDASGVSSQPALYNLHLLPSSVLAGTSSTGTVYLVGLASSGGVVVTTSSDNAAAVPPASVTVPQNGTSANFTVTTTAVSTTTKANISTAYSGSTITAPLTITPVADFTMAVGPAQLTLFPGQSGTFNGTLTSVAGYNSAVALSCAGSAPPTCNFSPSVLTPTSSGAPFTLTVSSSTATDYSFNIQGVGSDSKTTTHQVATTVSVVDFTLGTPAPASITEFPGTGSQFTVQVGALGSFSATVELSCNTPATGIACSFSPSASVSPTTGNPINVTVTVSSTTATPTGQYTLSFSANAANAPAPKTQTVTLNVVDFTLGAPSPSSISTFPSTSSQITTVVGASGPFSGSVTLSCNAPALGVTCSFAPSATVSPTVNNPVTVTVTVATTSTTPIGQYTVLLSATSAGAPSSKTQSEILDVVDFSLGAASPPSVGALVGGTAQFTTQVAAAGNFSGMVSLSCNSPATGITCSFSPAAIVSPTSNNPISVTVTVLTTSATPVGQYTLTITANSAGAPSVKTQTETVNVSDFTMDTPSPSTVGPLVGGTAQFSLQVGAAGSFSGVVTLSCNAPAAGVTCSFAPSAAVSPTVTAPVNVAVTVSTSSTTPSGQYVLAISADSTGAPSAKSQNVTLNISDFALGTASPANVATTVGSSAQFAVQVTAAGTFSGTVSLACSAPVTGVTCSFAPAAVVSPTAAKPVNVTVSVVSALSSPAGPFSLMLSATATGAPSAKTQVVAVDLTDFGLTSSAGSLTVSAGHTADFPLNVAPLGGSFASPVSLSCSGLPKLATCTFSPASAMPGASTANVTLSISTVAPIALAQPAGSHSLPLYAFCFPLAALVFAGPALSGRSRKQLSTVLFTAILLVMVAGLVGCGGGSMGGSGRGPQPQPGTPAGTYQITVTGSAGSLTHSTTVTLTVQ